MVEIWIRIEMRWLFHFMCSAAAEDIFVRCAAFWSAVDTKIQILARMKFSNANTQKQ